jgi:hypothetical protein
MKTLLIAFGIAVIMTMPIAIYLEGRDDTEVDSLLLDAKTKAYNQAKAENDSVQKRYDAVIANLMDSISVLNKELQYSDLLLTQIKNKRNEKVNSINKLTTDELSRAITNNYKERIAD